MQVTLTPTPPACEPRQPATARRTVAIVQSNYIPWKGYFDLIRRSDLFILYDDVQFTRRDWRNRNAIKTPQGLCWLTIPVQVKGRYTQRICDVQVSDPSWARTHWQTLVHNYSRAPYWGDYRLRMESLYMDCKETLLSRINARFLAALSDMLNIRTPIRVSMDYRLAPGRTERLVDLCRQAGATHYLSGPAARDYLAESLFAEAGMQVMWMDYSGYSEYPQLYAPFEHKVSVLDLLLQTGPNAVRYLEQQ